MKAKGNGTTKSNKLFVSAAIGFGIGVVSVCSIVGIISKWPVKADGYADYGEKGRITDEEVFKHMCGKTNFITRLNPKKVCAETLWSFAEISP